MPDKIDLLFDDLQSRGYAKDKTRKQFRDYMLAPGKQGYENRKTFFEDFKSNGETDLGSYEDFKGLLGLHAVKKPAAQTPSVYQKAQQKAAQKPVQSATPRPQPAVRTQQSAVSQPAPKGDQLQLPEGFGALNTNDVLNSGFLQNRVNSGQQEKPQESVVDKTQRMLQGKATTQEQRQTQKRLQQRLDEAQYENATGQQLRNTGIDISFEAPTLSRDENGQPIIGRTTDEANVQAHRQVAEEQQRQIDIQNAEEQARQSLQETNKRLHDIDQARSLEYMDKERNKSFLDRFLEAFRMPTVNGLSPYQEKAMAERTNEEMNLINSRRSLDYGLSLVEDARKDAELSEGKWYEKAGKGLARAYGKAVEVASKPETWDFGASDMEKQFSLLRAVINADNGVASESDKKLLDDFALSSLLQGHYEDKLSGWTKAGLVTGESLPFMLEMFANPASGIGRKASESLLRYSIKKYGTKYVRDHMKQIAAKKIAARVLGDVVGAHAMASTTGAMRTLANTYERMRGDVRNGVDENGRIIYDGHEVGESAFDAFSKAWRSTAIENWSEMAGEYLPFMTGFFGNAIGKSVIGKAGREALKITGNIENVGLNKAQKFIYDLAANKGIGAFSKGLDDFLKRTQWHGVLGEYSEEVLGNLANALTVGDMTLDTAEGTGVFNLQQNIDTFNGVALMGGFTSALQTGGFAADRYRNSVSRRDSEGAKVFGSGWERVKAAIDSSADDAMELNNVLSDFLGKDFTDKKQKEAILNYTSAVLQNKGAEMAQYQPRMQDSTREEVTTPEGKKYIVTSKDKNGETIQQQSFDSEDEAIAYEGELKMQQQHQDFKTYFDMTNKPSMAESESMVNDFLAENGFDEADDIRKSAMLAAINDPSTTFGKRFQQYRIDRTMQKAQASQEAIATFEEENGWTPGTVRWLTEQDPMQLDDEGLQMQDEASAFLETLAYPSNEVHVEHEQEKGAEAAKAVVEQVVSTEEAIDPNDNAGKDISEQWAAAQANRTAAFEKNEELKQEVERMEGMGLSPQEVISSLDTFRPEEVQAVVDYYNAQARWQSMVDEASKQIDSQARRRRERNTFKGTINGQADVQNLQTISDGTNTYTLVSGNVTTGADGKITGSTSGLIIGLDAEGNFVQIGDGDGYSVMPVAQTLDQFEDTERTRLQEQVTQVIDPNGALAGGAEAVPQPTEQGQPAGEAVVEGKTSFLQDIDLELWPQVKEWLDAHPDATVGQMQREFKIGYNKATRMAKEYGLLKEEENGAQPAVEAGAEGTGADETAGAAPEIPQGSALERIPKDEGGNPLYEQASSDDTYDALVEQVGKDTARVLAQNQLNQAKKNLEKLNKKMAKGEFEGNSLQEQIESSRKLRQAMDAEQGRVEYWNAVMAVPNNRRLNEENNPPAAAPAAPQAPVTPSAAPTDEAPEWRYDTPKAARERGYKVVEGNRIDRQEEKEMPKGMEVEVQYSTKDKVKGHLTVSELGDVQGSHLTNGQRNERHFMPEAQPKAEFGADRQAAAQTNASEANFRPELMLTFNGTQSAYSGSTTQTNRRGEVIQGNGRRNLAEYIYAPGNEAVAKRYKEYLMAHAEELGTTAEEIAKMEKPFAHIVLDVTDEEAIRLGQFTAQDLESGGKKIPDVTVTSTKLGEKFGALTNIILNHEDPDASLAERVEANAEEAVRWLNRGGYINDTEAKTLLEDKGAARQFIKDLLTNTLFNGASPDLRTMFYELPKNIQSAIVSVVGREVSVDAQKSILEDLRESIQAYHELMISSQQFAGVSGRNYEERKRAADAAVSDWLRQINMDGTQNSEKFSNFALELAKLYRSLKDQKTLSGRLKEYYDLVSGASRQADMFGETNATGPLAKEEAIKQIFGIDYGRQRTVPLAGNNQAGQTREQGGTGRPQSREREEGEGGPSDTGRGDTGDAEVKPTLSREDYLASHPLTEEQIMADTEATEDEKLNAIDFLKGEDDSAISRFYYDSIYNRSNRSVRNNENTPGAEATVALSDEEVEEINTSNPVEAIEQAASSFREGQKAKDQQDIDDALKEFNDFLDNAKGSNVLDKFMRKGLEGNDKAQANLLDAFTLTNEAQRMFLKDLLRLASKVGYAYIKSGVHDVQAWSRKMSDSIGRKLKEVLGWDDAIVGEFVDEVWNQKYTVDGVRMRLSEHAERLKNNKGEDTAVNVNKKENNEEENVVSSQEEASEEKPKTKDGWLKKLEGVYSELCKKYGVPEDPIVLNSANQRYGFDYRITKGYLLEQFEPYYEAYKKKLDDEVEPATEKQLKYIEKLTESDEKKVLEGVKLNKISASYVISILKSEEDAQTAQEFDEAMNELRKVAELAGKKYDEELEGDSAAFAERQEKIGKLRAKVADRLQELVMWNDKPQPMSFYKKLAEEAGLSDLSTTDLQEIIESEVVNYARELANKEGWTEKQKYDHIVRLYNAQPTLSARDNDRINLQQYSTPAPMAYLMGMFCRSGRKNQSNLKGLEPSAGNGMLTIGLPKEGMHVNDIDEMRLSNLQKQGFGEVTSQDGTQSFGGKKYDVIVTNPPFGNVTPKVYDGIYEISGLEHQMAINALESMKDDGRAAIIIGGNTEYNTNGSIKGKDRVFLNYLYAHYNVVDVINMDGKTLYSRQGTGYPVRMILINGRKEFNAKDFAPVQSKARAEQVKSYDELFKRVNDDILSDKNKSAGVHDTEGGTSGRVDDNSNAGNTTQTGVRNVRTEGSQGQPAGSTSGRPSVQRGDNTTNGTDGGSQPAVGGRPSGVGGRPSTTKPSGATPAQAGGQRGLFDGGDNTQRPSAQSGNSVGVGQRGAGAAQQDNGSVESAGNAAVTVTETEPKPEVKRGLGTEKVPYRKKSGNPFTLQSLMPAEQADVVKEALDDLGDVDQFLVDELGYSSKEELHQALAAEQIDSVAMAIHQMNQGNAFIIGDQTGIGKGRQAAALIRYGVKKGGCPVFITVKKALFSDMYRDLCDIGSPGLRPFIWSADDAQHSGAVTDKDGKVIYEMPSKKEQERVVAYINKNGKLPPEYDYVLTTYDSFKSGTMDYEGGQKTARRFPRGKNPSAVHINGQAKRDALETLAHESYVIMDESHNAGGEGSNVSKYLQYITTRTRGITFLSATFAKRPGNMPIYSLKTAIAKAGVAVDELIDAVKRGGATFQEIMSKALTEAGQMIRRERDMTGVTIDWKGIEDEEVVQKQREQYDQVIGLFNDIINFQRSYVDPIIDGLNDAAADVQGAVDHTPGTRDMGINNTPFASRTYNIVQQVLLSLKAEEAAKRAIEHLKAGRKPVITVANTNEGAADEVAAAGSDSMEMPDLSVNLKKGLRGTLRFTEKDAFGNTVNRDIPFDSLSPEGQARYREIMDSIDKASTGLSLSPIDVIKNELKKAGYKVGELTGRQSEFVYNEDGTVKRVRRTNTDKKKIASDFNNGRLDALILNRSAGTGISLHASSKFDDQRQRVMIVAQAQGDVNDEVQIRGRIDRTGQVLRGMYEYIVSQIPSEQRLLMMLKAKLRSLDANTTSSQKSKFNEMQVQDIINKYGDDIVVQYLAEHPDLADKMCNPLKWQGDWQVMSTGQLVEAAQKDGEAGKTASKVLGRMALLTVKEQEKMLAEIGELYQAEIDRLNEMGENDLEITEMPLKAKTLSKAVWEQGIEPGGKNPFADNSYVEKVQMDVLKKPMKGEEVKRAQAHLLGGKTWDEYKKGILERVDEWAENKKKETTETITARAEKKAKAEQERYVKGAKKAQAKNEMTDEEIERNGQFQYKTIYEQEMDKLNEALTGIERQKQVFVDALELFDTNRVFAIPSNIYDLGGMTFEPGMGKLIDIKISDNFSTTASTLSFATLDGRRKITIPVSGMVKQQNNEKRSVFPAIMSLTAQTKNGMFGSNVANTLRVLEQNLDNWDKLTSSAARKDGYIITGNLLKALVSTREQSVGGKLISYTTDTGEVRQGILMPDNFDPKGLTSKTPISARKEELRYGRDEVVSADGDVKVRVTNDWDWHNNGYNTLELIVPKSKKKGEKYFNDEVLLSLMNGQFEGSGKMKAEFPRTNLDAVMKRLDELGVTVTEENNDNGSTAGTGRRYSEDIVEGGEKKRTIEEDIARFAEKYNTVPGILIHLNEISDRDLCDIMFRPMGVNINDYSEAEIAEAAKELREDFSNVGGFHNQITHGIVIFAENIPKEGGVEKVLFHENVHAILYNLYGEGSRSVADAFWDATPEEVNGRTKDFIRNGYSHKDDKTQHEEWFVYNLMDAMLTGDFESIDRFLSSSQDSLEAVNNILKEIGYDREKEKSERGGRGVQKTNSARASEREGNSRNGQERKDAGGDSIRKQKPSGHQERIAKHIDALVKKLGTKAKTTVYHSFDELPEDMKAHISQRERQGRKVKGWYENGRVYLYLPHISSEYEAEQVIWHETVAHHGLRQLIGEENLNKLLTQLWMEHKDGDMGRWVTERMQLNGWSLGEAIEEYLAREAEKNPFKEPSLWQRLRWLVAEALHKMGFATDPTIADVQYLFWLSQNQLRNGDALSVAKQQAFLHRLEREAGNTPYVNMEATRVEDIYDPDAEGAYDDGRRQSEETDEEVIERLDREPKVKVYRAMQLVDGKLYPPMAAKVNGKWQDPMELGKWAKADEHPELVNKNGKFDLDKGNGKKVAGVVYAPYMHGSTTMLNDQFKEAQDRPELVVVEAEMPESELTSGYQAEKSPRKVGMLDWKAGTIQGQLTGTRQVMLSRWVKPIRIVPSSEVAASIKEMIDGQVDVMPTNVVTPEQRKELEKLGVKFVKTDNKEIIQEGEHKGEQYSSAYGKKAKEIKSNRRFSEDIEEPLEKSVKRVYEETIDTKAYVFTEAFQDAMLALKVFINSALKKGEKLLDSQNAYQAENLMHGKSKNEMDLFNEEHRKGLEKIVTKILNTMGWTMRDFNIYLMTKSGLERNREFFVRDWLEKQRKKSIKRYEDLNDTEKELYDVKANNIETMFEDGDITEEEKQKALVEALQETHDEWLNDIERGWASRKRLASRIGETIVTRLFTFADYLGGLDNFIRSEIDGEYVASEHDYSGLTEMYGDAEGKYDEDAIIEQLANDEGAMDAAPDGSTVDELWERIRAANRYALERYREAGMRTDEQIDRIEQMFNFYVPMRGFDKNMGEDVYQYFTSNANANSYVGGLIKHARGRKSMANSPLATMFAMAYKAISDCNENRMKQHFYRFCQAHPNDLVVMDDAWVRLNEVTGEWKEVWPDIPDDATDEQVREAVKRFEEENRQLATEGKAMKIRGKADFEYKPIDKKHKAEHTVEVMINGQKKLMTIVGNPRVAQALNGHTRWENGKDLIRKANAFIKNKMSAAFTSYSPTFAMRNMLRDWTHFAMMLNTREGKGYAKTALKYYKETLPRPYHGKGKTGMVELFKKYRAGTLDMTKEVERDFKDFMDNGGVTGYVQMHKVEKLEKELRKMVGDRTGSEKVMDKVGYWLIDNLHLQGAINLNNKFWDCILGIVEAYNEAVENNARFATYRASRHYAQRTKARSAYDAKEITVNFNKKGSGWKVTGLKTEKSDVGIAAQTAGVTSQVVGEGKIFFNATVQAIANTFKMFKNADGTLNKKYISTWAGKYALPPFAFGLMLPYINHILAAMITGNGGDDDDKWYERALKAAGGNYKLKDDPYANLPEWTRRKNLCFYVGKNSFVTIPIGQELAAFLALGDIAAGNLYAPDLKPIERDWVDEVEGVLNTFSPVDLDTKITRGGLMEDPVSETLGRISSVLAPVIAVEQNLGWTGRPIYKEDTFPGDEFSPEYQMVYQSTNPLLVAASKKLHEKGGGNDRARGKDWSEVNPAIVQYLWEQYTGGPGKVFSNTISIGKDVGDLIGEVYRGEGIDTDFNMRKVEGLKAFIQQGDDRTPYYRTNTKFFKYQREANKYKHDYDVTNLEKRAKHDPEARLELEKLEKTADYQRYEIMKEANRSSKKEGKVGLDELRKEIKEITDRKERREQQRVYNELVKKTVDLLDQVGKVEK